MPGPPDTTQPASPPPLLHGADAWGRVPVATAWRGPRPSNAVAWVLLLLAFAGSVVLGEYERLHSEPASPVAGDIIIEIQGKALYAIDALGSGRDAPAAAAPRQMMELATTPGTAWRVAAVLSATWRAEDAPARLLDLLHSFDDEVAALGGDAAAIHEAVVAAVEDPHALSPQQRSRLIDQLGWFGRVLVSHESGSQDPDRVAARHEAYRVMWVGVAAMCGGVLALLVGTVLLMWKLFAHLRQYGELRIEMHHIHVPAAIYLEAAALYLGIVLAFSLVADFVPGVQVSATVGFAFLAFASVAGVAWPFIRYRGAREVAAELGLTRGRGVWREIGAGVAGYLAVLPLLMVGVLLVFAGAKLYEELSQAYHWETNMRQGPTAPHPALQWIANGSVLVKFAVLMLASGFAPFFEETMFRGALLNGAARSIGLTGAILAMAFIFAAIHPQGWLAIPALMSLAIGLALIRLWRRGCLIAPMTAHALHNGIVMLGAILLLG